MPEAIAKPRYQEKSSQEDIQHETRYDTRDTRRGQDRRRSPCPALQYHRHTESPLPVRPSVQGQVSLSGSAGLWTPASHLSSGIHGENGGLVIRHLIGRYLRNPRVASIM